MTKNTISKSQSYRNDQQKCKSYKERSGDNRGHCKCEFGDLDRPLLIEFSLVKCYCDLNPPCLCPYFWMVENERNKNK